MADAQDCGWTELHEAARLGDTAAVSSLLASAKKVDAKTTAECQGFDAGATPLLVAARHGHVEAIELLLHARARVSGKNKKGATPLHCAALGGHTAAARMLLAAAADPAATLTATTLENMYFSKGTRALHIAAGEGHAEIVELLLEAGQPPDGGGGEPPLLLAAKHGHADVVRALLRGGAAHEGIKDGWGWTALGLALAGSHLDTARALIEVGARADYALSSGSPIVAVLARDASSEAVALSLDAGADVAATDPDGWTALHVAVAWGRPRVVELLLARGAAVDRLTARNRDLRLSHTTDACIARGASVLDVALDVWGYSFEIATFLVDVAALAEAARMVALRGARPVRSATLLPVEIALSPDELDQIAASARDGHERLGIADATPSGVVAAARSWIDAARTTSPAEQSVSAVAFAFADAVARGLGWEWRRLRRPSQNAEMLVVVAPDRSEIIEVDSTIARLVSERERENTLALWFNLQREGVRPPDSFPFRYAVAM